MFSLHAAQTVKTFGEHLVVLREAVQQLRGRRRFRLSRHLGLAIGAIHAGNPFVPARFPRGFPDQRGERRPAVAAGDVQTSRDAALPLRLGFCRNRHCRRGVGLNLGLNGNRTTRQQQNRNKQVDGVSHDYRNLTTFSFIRPGLLRAVQARRPVFCQTNGFYPDEKQETRLFFGQNGQRPSGLKKNHANSGASIFFGGGESGVPSDASGYSKILPS
jgi:hypothetical protein